MKVYYGYRVYYRRYRMTRKWTKIKLYRSKRLAERCAREIREIRGTKPDLQTQVRRVKILTVKKRNQKKGLK